MSGNGAVRPRPADRRVGELLEQYGLSGIAHELYEYISGQRWFGSRDATVTSTAIVDAAVISDVAPITLFALTEIVYADGVTQRYATPLHLAGPLGDSSRTVIAVIQRNGETVAVSDAIGDPECVVLLWQMMNEHTGVETQLGELRGVWFGEPSPVPDPGELRPSTAEGTNSAVVREDTEFFKWVRRIERGPSVDVEMTEALGAGGFAQLPASLAAIDYVRDGEPAVRVGHLHAFLHNAVEAWPLALTSLRDLYAIAEDAEVISGEQRRRAVADQGATFVPDAARLGEVTAAMHTTLATQSVGGGIAARSIDSALLEIWADTMTGELDRVIADREKASDLVDQRDSIASQFDAIRHLTDAGLAIRIHGDYHLGQIARTNDGWVVLDFEGEPTRPLAERREHASPLRDVAGMLRSFDYAAAVALTERMAPDDDRWPAFMALGDTWAEANRKSFWEAYLAGVADTDLLGDMASALTLRRALEVQKAVYEVEYESGYRPTWVGIPMAFLSRVGGRVTP